MSDFPQKVMVWHSDPSLNHTGTWSTTRYPDGAVAYAPVDEAMREAVGLACALHRRHYQDDAPQWEPLDTVAGVISQIDNMTAGMADEITALRARLAEVERERDDYVRVSATWCSMMDGKLLEQKTRAERAEAALATARRDAYERAAKMADALQRKIKHDEADALMWSGPDPRGEQARQINLSFAGLLRDMSSRIRALANEAPE